MRAWGCAFAAASLGLALAFSASDAQAQAPRAPVGGVPSAPLPTPPEARIEVNRRAFTDVEVKLLQELEQRRVELERREQALLVRERLVDLAEGRLKDRVTTLQKIQTGLETLLKNLSDKEEAELADLAKIYEQMKPAAAAIVLEKLDDRIVYDVFRRMKNKTTAKILEKMSPVKAKVISEMMAEKRQVPPFDGDQPPATETPSTTR
jgi:flagellar motility protein MotE (MotC chaperone)